MKKRPEGRFFVGAAAGLFRLRQRRQCRRHLALGIGGQRLQLGGQFGQRFGRGLLQPGDEEGPVAGEVGYGEEAPNATVQVRGQTSSSYTQKNYKVELKKGKGTWRQQRAIALNKHMGEGMRFRNKMAYDLIRGIPQMMGLRTQFVHLWVCFMYAPLSNKA